MGDWVVVKSGENVPLDGEVVDGASAVNQSVSTGESALVNEQPGDEIIGGSVNETGMFLIEVLTNARRCD